MEEEVKREVQRTHEHARVTLGNVSHTRWKFPSLASMIEASETRRLGTPSRSAPSKGAAGAEQRETQR